MRWTYIAVLAFSFVAGLGVADRATAFGVPNAAVVAQVAPAPMPQAPFVRVHGWCGWKHDCYLTPQYFRYPPPSVTVRCFNSLYGNVHCPYSERPVWWRGCWMDRTGRLVCQKGGYHW